MKTLSRLMIAILSIVMILCLLPTAGSSAVAAGSGIKAATQKVSAAGRTFTVQTVRIPKGTKTDVGLANQQVGQTASLSSIVKHYGAQAAINGAFFEAYGGAPDPYGTLIKNGRIAHLGRYGTTIGFLANGTALMDSLRLSVTGTVQSTTGKSSSWYAIWVNRLPGASSTSVIYTSDRGTNTGFTGGIAVTVVNNKVTHKGNNNKTKIPSNGYVLVYTGDQKYAADRFTVGATVNMNIAYQDINGKDIPWQQVVTAVGAGPRLVKDSKIALNAEAEGFQDPKILTAAGARSGIAIMADGSVMIATVPGATMKQWAAIMQKLGAKQAMNLDGGASSGMYANGRMLTAPGRLLSNTLIFGASGS
ncbi:phosphodiester glycosidase family protein [Paenibacillus sp. KACC 21273]|uniref:phosphodiester glycosidase family protein n=1 Tax=Paenibacillus sp. KACC 21273 TaxID=3025665 RepID=UPI0023667C65|nr:phosphodiester glycosidase family protein [Paenibacillus sp. KACC 21273]WDF49694.1 phosphodiester glycosidase family protein [Paenibacillus sp. KACC 21273]